MQSMRLVHTPISYSHPTNISLQNRQRQTQGRGIAKNAQKHCCFTSPTSVVVIFSRGARLRFEGKQRGRGDRTEHKQCQYHTSNQFISGHASRRPLVPCTALRLFVPTPYHRPRKGSDTRCTHSMGASIKPVHTLQYTNRFITPQVIVGSYSNRRAQPEYSTTSISVIRAVIPTPQRCATIFHNPPPPSLVERRVSS